MISPSPTQQRPELETIPEKQHVISTPARRRAGQTPAALFVKALLRPIIKLLYYIIVWIRGHVWLSILGIILLLASIITTNSIVTGTLPFGLGPAAPLKVEGNQQVNPRIVAWLQALRDGDTVTMNNLQQAMVNANLQPVAPSDYILKFGQSQANITWKNVRTLSISTASDGTVDTFVEVDYTLNTNGTNRILLWHFTTIPSLGNNIYFIDLVTLRGTLQ